MKGILLASSTGPSCTELGDYSGSSRRAGGFSVLIRRFGSKPLILFEFGRSQAGTQFQGPVQLR
jgi:hypothetical protein